MALIELFAWMTELSLFRLNQVPDAFYTHMLNMLGFERFPATAARTELVFWLVDVAGEPVVVPAGTQVSTVGEVGPPRVFTSLLDLQIAQPVLKAALVSPGPDVYTDVWEALRVPDLAVVCFPRTPDSADDRFYLGFEHSLAGNAISMHMDANIEGIGVIPTKPPLRWEVWQGSGWIPTTVYRDTTGGLNRDGEIVLLVPSAHEPLTLAGERAFWLRAKAARAGTGTTHVSSVSADPQHRRQLDRRFGDRRAQRASPRARSSDGARANPTRCSRCATARCSPGAPARRSRSPKTARPSNGARSPDFIGSSV